MTRKRQTLLVLVPLFAVAAFGALVSWVEPGQGNNGVPPLPASTVTVNETGGQDSGDSAPLYLPGGFKPAHSDLTVNDLSTFSNFAVYWPGRRVGPYALTAILREHRTIEEPEGFDPVTVDRLSLIYGDCVVSGDVGCSPPLEIQIWPSCQRPLAQAKALGGRAVSSEELGVPTVELANRTEIATEEETVVVFGAPDLRDQAITQLHPANERARQAVLAKNDGTLPAPASGVLVAGKSCK